MDFLAHAWLTVDLPVPTRQSHVLSIGFRGQQCFF
jgi:hypothetical protein